MIGGATTSTGNESPIAPCPVCGQRHTYNEGREKGCYD